MKKISSVVLAIIMLIVSIGSTANAFASDAKSSCGYTHRITEITADSVTFQLVRESNSNNSYKLNYVSIERKINDKSGKVQRKVLGKLTKSGQKITVSKLKDNTSYPFYVYYYFKNSKHASKCFAHSIKTLEKPYLYFVSKTVRNYNNGTALLQISYKSKKELRDIKCAVTGCQTKSHSNKKTGTFNYIVKKGKKVNINITGRYGPDKKRNSTVYRNKTYTLHKESCKP